MEQTLDSSALREKVDALIECVGGPPAHADMIREVVLSALSLFQNGIVKSDLKTFHATFNEMAYALHFFAPYTGIKKISIFGSARTSPDEPICLYAAEFARQLAEANFMVITGAGDGIMRAVQRGAGREKSFGINIILPFGQEANEFIDNDPKLITFKYFFVRKLFFVKEANALAFFPGGFGTHDEGFEALTLLQTGKSTPMPVVFVDTPNGNHWEEWFSYVNEKLLGNGLISSEDLNLFKITDRVEDAVYEITHFYHHYHSMQFVNDKTVIRLNRRLMPGHIERLNDCFSDIIVSGKIVETEPLWEEKDEPQFLTLPRLAFHFNRKNFGRLREMVNQINDFSFAEVK